MTDLTLVLPCFRNLGMLAEQQKVWADYPADLRSRLHVIVVDDSPKGARPSRKSVTVTGLGSFRIFRLVNHLRWNWLAKRNLGVREARTQWVLLTDIDHVMPMETCRRLLDGPALRPDVAYRFSRVDAIKAWPYALAVCPPYKPHNDSWLMTRGMFYYDDGTRFVGGYDERLSGCYGTSGEFTDRVLAVAAHRRLSEVLVRYPREIIPDASTSPSLYARKNDPDNDEELTARKAMRAAIEGWRPLHGLIPHELVYDSTAVEAAA